MIRLFTLNVSEEILKKFKDLEVYSYFDKFCTPVAQIWYNNKFVKLIRDADYDRINACILELRRREKSNGI